MVCSVWGRHFHLNPAHDMERSLAATDVIFLQRSFSATGGAVFTGQRQLGEAIARIWKRRAN